MPDWSRMGKRKQVPGPTGSTKSNRTRYAIGKLPNRSRGTLARQRGAVQANRGTVHSTRLSRTHHADAMAVIAILWPKKLVRTSHAPGGTTVRPSDP